MATGATSWNPPIYLDWLYPLFGEYCASLGYVHGVIAHDQCSADKRGNLRSDSLELFAGDQQFSARITFAHSLEDPMQ